MPKMTDRPTNAGVRRAPPAWWDPLRKRIARARCLALLLDFDGTLAGIAPRPEEASLEPAMRELLRRLLLHPRVRVAVISGRALEDLRQRVDLEGCYLSGSHGLTVEGPAIRFVHPAAARAEPALRRIARTLRTEISAIPGALVEEKRYSVACHYRMAPRAAVAAAKAAVLRLAALESERASATGSNGWRILRGHQVLEILPRVAWTKSECAEFLLAHFRSQLPRGETLLPIAAGDDRTDLDLFSAVRGSGFSFAVGTRAAKGADWVLRGVAGVRELLERLVDILPSWPVAGPAAEPRTGGTGEHEGRAGLH
jgi:trehalose-phosphatase